MTQHAPGLLKFINYPVLLFLMLVTASIHVSGQCIPVTPAVGITVTSGNQITCAGSSVTFTAAPVNGGNTPNYNFSVNGTTVQNGTSARYTYGPANNDVVSCIMTSNAACASPATASSNSITLTVYTAPAAPATVNNQAVCTGGATAAVYLSGSGPGSVYNWTGSNSSIGLPASGVDSIPAFTVTNTGATPIVDTITVTAVLPANHIYITNLDNNTVSVADPASGAILTTIPVGSSPQGVATSPGGGLVYIANTGSNSISVINTASNTVTATIPVQSGPSAVAFSADGSTAYVSNTGSGSVTVINTATNIVTATISSVTWPGSQEGLCVSPDGTKLYVTGNDALTGNYPVIVTVDLTADTLLGSVVIGNGEGGDSPVAMCMTPDGNYLYVINHAAGTVTVVSTASNTVVTNIPIEIKPWGICISPDGSHVYATNGMNGYYNYGTVSVIATSTNTVTATIEIAQNPWGICTSPDGSQVYVACTSDNSVEVIDAATNTVINNIPGFSGPWSLNGNFAVAVPACSGAPTTFTITVNPAATAGFSDSIGYCGSVSLTATGNITYSWSGGNSPGTATNTFTASGTYTVTVTNSNGCQGTSSKSIVVGPVPPAPAAINNQAICSGSTTAGVAFSDAASNVFYSWTGSNSSIGLPASGVDSIPAFTAINTGTTPIVDTITATAALPANHIYITNIYNNTVSVADVASGAILETVPVGSSPQGVATSPGGGLVYIANSGSNSISVINTATNTVTATIPVQSGPSAVAFSADGSTAYVSNTGSGSVTVINTATNVVTATISSVTWPGSQEGLCVSPDGTKLYVTGNDALTGNYPVIVTVNLAAGTLAGSVVIGNGEGGDSPVAMCMTPDGNYLYVINHAAGTVTVVSTASNTVVTNIPIEIKPWGICISPDGSHVYATNGMNGYYNYGTVSVIATSTNTVTATIEIAQNPWGICTSPDGSQVYVACAGDNSVEVIDAATNNVINNIQGFSGPWSLNGNFAVVGPGCSGAPTTFTITVNPAATAGLSDSIGYCGSVSLTATGGSTYSWSGGNSPGTATNTFTASGTYTVTATNSDGCQGTASTSIVVGPVPPAPAPVSNQAVCSGSTTAAVNFSDAASNVSYIWTNSNPAIGLPASGSGNIAAFTAINTGTTPVVATISASASFSTSNLYISNSTNNSVSVVNTTNGSIIKTIPVGSSPQGVTISPNGNLAYVTNNLGLTVSVINTASNTLVATIPAQSEPSGVAFSPDGSKAYVTNTGTGEVLVINTATNTVTATIAKVTRAATEKGLCISPDGSVLYVTGNDAATGKLPVIASINTATNTVTGTITIGDGNAADAPCAMCISPDGKYIYVVNHAAATVSVVSTASNAVVANIAIQTKPIGICISPDGSHVYATNDLTGAYSYGTVSVISTATNTVTATVQVGKNPYGVCTSADGSTIYVACAGSNSVSVINAATNKVVNTIGGFSGPNSLYGNFLLDIPGCSGAATSFTITANPAVTAGITGTDKACGSVTLTATGGSNYTWSGGNSPEDETNTFTGNGTYRVTVTSSTGCSATASQVVKINAIPDAAITGNSTACNSVSLTAKGGSSYSWSGGSTPTTATNKFSSSNTYTVTVTGTDGCTATTSALVTINPSPAVVIAGSASGCSSVTLTATGGTGYSWSGGSDMLAAANTFSKSGNYKVTVTNSYGCSATASQAVTIKAVPAVKIVSSIIPSNTCSELLSATGGNTYLWSGGETPYEATNTTTIIGTYTVTATGTDGCTTSASVSTTAGTPPQPEAITGPDAVCQSDTAQLYFINAVQNAEYYLWTVTGGAAITSSAFGDSAIVNFVGAGDTINLQVTANNGCGSSPASYLTINPASCLNDGFNSSMNSAGADDKLMQITAYPNPTSGLLMLAFGATANEKFTFSITDVTGNEVRGETYAATTGNNLMNFDLSHFAKGIYFVKAITEAREVKTFKIIVQ